MDQLYPLLVEIRDVACEARDQLDASTIDVSATEGLIARLNHCTDKAAKFGFVYSELELDRLAYALERRSGILSDL